MPTLKAVVSGGRAIIEDVGDYPDGTELEVEIVVNHEMSADEKAKLDAVLEASWAQYQRGEVRPMSDVIADLRARGQ